VWVTILCIFGIGNGMILTSVNVAIQAISKAEDCGRAAAMYAFMRTLGMSIGVAVGGTTFQNIMSHKLHELGLPDAIAKNAEAFVQQLWYLQESDPVRIGALQAYVQGFHGVFSVMTATALTGLVVSLFIKRHSMDKPLASTFILQVGGRVPVHNQNMTAMQEAKEIESGHSSMTSAMYSMWSSGLGQADIEKSMAEQHITELHSKQPEAKKVDSFLVGPGGWRVPVDPVSGGPLPLPQRMSQASGPLPQMPEAVYPTSPTELKRISSILAPFS
jgi:hypothetical protein